MAISDGTAGAWTTPTTTPATTSLPTHSAGQMILLRVGCKSPAAATENITVSTSGWTKIGQHYDGGGNSSNGGGGVIVAAFYKVAASSSETAPTIVFGGGNPAPGFYSVVTYSKGSDEEWVAPEGAGGSIAAATSYTATMGSHIAAKSGDMLDAFVGTNDNTTLTVPTVSQAGLTLDTVTEFPATALSTTVSNDVSADGCNRLATAGTSSAAAVVSGTNSVADPGAAWVTRLRVNKLITVPLLTSTSALYAPTIIPDQLLTLPLLESVGGIVRGSQIVSDDFTTDSASTWPNAPTGGAYSDYLTAFTGASYAVSGGAGLMTAPAGQYQQGNRTLTGISAADIDLETHLSNTLVYANEFFGLAWRIQGAGTTYYATYVEYDDVDADFKMRVYKYVSGIGTQLITPLQVFTNSIGLKLRVAHVGSTLKIKTWQGTEPEAWTVELTENSISGAGGVGVIGADYAETTTGFLFFYGYNASLSVAAPALYAPVVERLSAGTTQTITLGLLDSGSALYAPTVSPQPVTVTLGLLESTPAVYAPTLVAKNTLTLGLLESTPALYAPDLTRYNTLTIPLLDAGPALYQPTLAAKNLIDLGLLESTPALYAPTLVPGPAQITVPLLDSTPALYAPTLAPQPVTITLDLIESTPALYAPSLLATNTITLGLLDAGAALYAPTVVSEQTVELPLLDGGPALYAPAIQPDQFLTIPLLESAPALYEPTLVAVARTFTLPLLESTPALYAPTLLPKNAISLGLIDAGPALYAPTLTPVNTITLGLLDAGAALYAPTVVPDQLLELPLLESTPDLYAPTVVRIGAGIQSITLDLLESTPALYAPSLTLAPYPITVPLLDAGPGLYAPVLTPKNTIDLGTIDAAPALFAPTIVPGAVAIILPLLDGGSALYAPTMAQGQAITLGLLDAGPAVYAPTLYAYNPIVLPLLDGEGALYAPTLTNAAVFITGITRDSNGTPLGSVEVHVFRTSDDVEVAQVTSNALGVFSIQVQPGIAHYIVAYKTGTPDRAGTTLNTLVGS